MNLDAMNNDELMAVSEDGTQQDLLRQYAQTLLQARFARVVGNIREAINCEAAAEIAYRDMPTHLKW